MSNGGRQPAELVADRFIRVDGSDAIDLGFGNVVRLRLSSNQSESAQARWAGRCASLFGVSHPALVPIVDYGVVDPRTRFDAWPTTGCRWKGERTAVRAAMGAAVGFLHDVGLSAGVPSVDRIVGMPGGPALLPDESTGEPLLDETARRREALAWRRLLDSDRCTNRPKEPRLFGIRLQPRTVLEAFVEWIEDSHPRGPRCLYLGGARRSGVTTELTVLVREARLRGFVPVHMNAVIGLRNRGFDTDSLRRRVAGRHLLLIAELNDSGVDRHPRRSRTALAGWLTETASTIAQPSAVVIVGRSSKREARRLSLERLDVSHLRRMLVGAVENRELEAAIRASDGMPGRFVDRLTPARIIGGWTARPSSRPAMAVAELAPPYGEFAKLRTTASLEDGRSPDWAPARDRYDKALREIAVGRHARAERLLRESIGAWSRRDDHPRTAEALMALGRLLHHRGRINQARRSLEEARRCFELAEDDCGIGRAAASLGQCLTDAGDLRQAETIIRSSVIVLDEADAVAELSRAERALARCLYWQDRVPEATAIVKRCIERCVERTQGENEAAREGVGAAVGLWTLRARLAVLDGDLPQAMEAAREAVARSTAVPGAFAESQAHAAMAVVLDAVGDRDGLRERVLHGLFAARKAHAPLMAVRLRVILCQGEDGIPRTAIERSALRSLSKLQLDNLPALLAARVRRVLARRVADARTAGVLNESVRRFVADSGARVLDRLLLSTSRVLPKQPCGPVIRDVIDMLFACQDADDECTALGRVGCLVRERTRASTVTVFGVESNGLTILAAAGSRTQPSAVAQRAIESGLLIHPDRAANTIEAAAPVRYGTVTVGAVVCRWTTEGPDDLERTENLLSAAAAACAPSVRLALDRREVPARVAAQEPDLIGISEAARELRRAIARAAGAPFTSLIEGASGSGKELVAKAIHRLSSRRGRRFCPVNCAALTDDLLEAELFGHARGAFTGAHIERAGIFEDAHGGTLFLDEVGELSPRAQAKLLRVLQEGEIRRIGETAPRAVDVRVIAATNRSLADEVSANRFRQDLFYRLNVIRIKVPPLRDRLDDIPILVAHFWRHACSRVGSRASLSPSAVAALARHDWPGNIRELQNVLATMAVSAPRRGSVGPSALPTTFAATTLTEIEGTLDDARREFERGFVRAALAREGGSRKRAAQRLGLSRQGLVKLLGRLRLDNAAERG